MHSDLLLQHFANPRNVGELPEPAVTVEISNPACGDVLRLSILFESGRASDARFRTRGCTASIAASSALTELIKNQELESLQALSAADIERALGGLAPESQHAAALCVDALRAALRKFGLK